jgi:hypothetical protein
MTDQYGRPQGYGQIAPGRQVPNLPEPPGQPGRPPNPQAVRPMVEPQPQRPQIQAQMPAPPANVGHDGVYNGQNRAQWRDAWMKQGRLTPQAADAYLRANGATEVNSGSGVWTTPHGETLDMQIARKAATAGRNGGLITAGWGRLGGGSAPRVPTIPLNANLQSAIEGEKPFTTLGSAEDMRAKIMAALQGQQPELSPFLRTYGK